MPSPYIYNILKFYNNVLFLTLTSNAFPVPLLLIIGNTVFFIGTPFKQIFYKKLFNVSWRFGINLSNLFLFFIFHLIISFDSSNAPIACELFWIIGFILRLENPVVLVDKVWKYDGFCRKKLYPRNVLYKQLRIAITITHHC